MDEFEIARVEGSQCGFFIKNIHVAKALQWEKKACQIIKFI
jgi:hypothetical protein